MAVRGSKDFLGQKLPAAIRSHIARVQSQVTRLPAHQVRRVFLAVAAAVVFMLLWGCHVAYKKVQRWRNCYPEPGTDPEGFTDPIYLKPTAYRDSAALTRPPDPCVETLDMPQVALLFLTKGTIIHETLWREWFSSAAGKVPLKALKTTMCGGSGQSSTLAPMCVRAPSADGYSSAEVIAQQHLFDVWVHPSTSFSGFPEGSIFHGLELPGPFRAPTVWGTHTLIDATRALLASALTNPRTVKFVLLSESDVPLYSPFVFYQQLVGDPRSRINACNTTAGWETDEWQRLRADMLESGMRPADWRKSWQWVALSRAHAQLAVDDEEVDAFFRGLCRRKWDQSWCDYRVCYSDEHYVPTLLAMRGEDNRTDCRGELTGMCLTIKN